MAVDNESQISDVPNMTDATALEVHEQFRRTEAYRVRMATAAAQGTVPRGPVEGVGGHAPANPQGEAGGNVPANPRGDQDAGRDTQIDALARRDAQIDVLMAAVTALTEQRAARTAHAQAPTGAPADQGVQMAQNTQELSLTTPVLFYGKCKDGKIIPPNAFLMELEARQTRHGWEPSMLLRFVKSCLRGQAALWWEGCILSYGDDQDQGPADNYVAFKVAFKQH
jgi:hypothetical protein